jgi:RecA-family ATPase
VFAPENTIVDVLTADDIEPTWLIPGMYLQGTTIAVAGESGVGKSVINYHLAMAVAAGVPAFGGLIPAGEPKRVLYFDEENSEQNRNKYIQQVWYGLMATQHDPDLALLQENLWVVAFNLGGEDWAVECEKWVRYVRPHAMWFDTATPCFHVQDENSNAEATAVLRRIEQIKRLTDPVCTALVMKHAKTRSMGEGRRRTMRGAKAWLSAADQTVYHVKRPGRPTKDGLSVTWIEPDKTRAWGLNQNIYVTPSHTDKAKTGIVLKGSYTASQEHRQAVKEEGGDE